MENFLILFFRLICFKPLILLTFLKRGGGGDLEIN